MKNLFFIMASLCLVMTSATALAGSGDPATVSNLDYNQYAGKWFVIAHSPNPYLKDCVNSTAKYTPESSTSFAVYNVCNKANGSFSDIEGTATAASPSELGKLRIRYNFFIQTDYWVVAVDPNYQWAVTSEPGKKAMSILSRVAPMQPELLQSILNDLKSKGFPVQSLIFDKY